MNNFITIALALLLLILGLLVGYGLSQDKQGNNQVAVGGEFVGTQSLSHINVGAGMTESGIYTISTTSATWTVNAREIRDVKVIAIGSVTGAAAMTLTLPALSTWQGLERVGDTQSWIIDNLHTTAATTTTVTAGTGVDIDGTTANDDVINGGVSGRLDCWRLPTSDIRCIVEEMVDAG